MQNVATAMLFSPTPWPSLEAKRPVGQEKKDIRDSWKLILEREWCVREGLSRVFPRQNDLET